jgi:hypothetical protein
MIHKLGNGQLKLRGAAGTGGACSANRSGGGIGLWKSDSGGRHGANFWRVSPSKAWHLKLQICGKI